MTSQQTAVADMWTASEPSGLGKNRIFFSGPEPPNVLPVLAKLCVVWRSVKIVKKKVLVLVTSSVETNRPFILSHL